MIFLTHEQKVVVEYRIADGYEFQIKPNGNYLLWKGCHTMEINCLGYDCHTRTGWARL